MSKGLDAFASICVLDTEIDMYSERERFKDVQTVKKELMAFEIIKNKDVDVVALRISTSLKQYNCKEDGRCPLTQEEYDLLKEVM